MGKCNHVVNVFYQYLDNDADGTVDDTKVHNEMASNNYLLYVPNTRDEEDPPPNGWPGSVRGWQMTGIFEATLNSCIVPTNRGASATDRSTWSNTRDTDGMVSCNNNNDATIEEVLHLITVAAGRVY